jgi:hypothetical protein
MVLSQTYLVRTQQEKVHLEVTKIWDSEMKAMKLCSDILVVKIWK